MMADSSRIPRDINEFYSDENGVNLRESTSNNLGLCNDDLFEDLFPSRLDPDICKEGNHGATYQGYTSVVSQNLPYFLKAVTEHRSIDTPERVPPTMDFPVSNGTQQDENSNTAPYDTGEDNAIKRHVVRSVIALDIFFPPTPT